MRVRRDFGAGHPPAPRLLSVLVGRISSRINDLATEKVEAPVYDGVIAVLDQRGVAKASYRQQTVDGRVGLSPIRVDG